MITHTKIRVAVVGAGYWGPNLIRNFVSCPLTELVAVCDLDPQRLDAVLAPYPHVAKEREYDELLRRSDIDAVAIATPVGAHCRLSVAALHAGKHVLVEKPLAASVDEGEQMINLARLKGLTLMVDHTFLYSPAVRAIQRLIDNDELGELYYIDSVRINLGLFQHDVNVLWDLAPHDLSIIDLLVGRPPKNLSAFGACHTGGGDLEDVAYLNLDYGGGLLASLHVNWLSPVKVRHFIVGGSRKSVVYNDLSGPEKVKVYDRGITITESPEDRRGVLVGYRTGDVWAPHLDQSEPLQNMVRHFAECILEGKRPLTDGEAGLRVVRILETAQQKLKSQEGRLGLERLPAPLQQMRFSWDKASSRVDHSFVETVRAQ